jgi:hypothetical protein
MSNKHEHDIQKREKKKEHEKRREEEWEKQPRSIHPRWFVAIGVLLIIAVVATWTLFFM